MKSQFYFIVEQLNGQRYDNIKKYDNSEFIISSSQEDHTVTNRFAKVNKLPMYYNGPIKVGDTIVVHHNVFRIYYDMKGNERSSWNFYKDNIFIIEEDQIFLYKDDSSDWNAIFPFCFVEPTKSIEIGILTTGRYEPLMGSIVYYPKTDSNIKINDIVSFEPESEYEFRIDDRLLYRMKLQNLCLKI
jgi:hypothetical protein